MATLAPSFLIGSSFLQIMRTTIKSRMSSILERIVHFTFELLVLERRNNSILYLVTELVHAVFIRSS